MIKSELIARIARKLTFLPENDIALCVNKILEKMTKHLSDGGRIEVRDFGNFTLRYRRPRLARNPKTNQRLMTQPKYVVHFKPGKGLKERVDDARIREVPIKELKDDEE